MTQALGLKALHRDLVTERYYVPVVTGVEFDSVDIAGIPTAICGRAETTSIYLKWVRMRRVGMVNRPLLASSMNGQTIYEALRRPKLRRLFERFDITSMDGQPAVLISRFWRHGFAERVATTDLVHDVVAAGIASGVRHFLLGATAEVADRAREHLLALHPGAIVAGIHHGFIADADLGIIAEQIRASNADIVWVCMGVPREQAVAVQLARLVPEVGVIKTGGGMLDFLSGHKARAPRWMQAMGFEWLFRLMLEPNRLFKRYMTSNIPSLLHLLSKRGTPVLRVRVSR